MRQYPSRISRLRTVTFLIGSLVYTVLTAQASTRYVDLNSPAPATPYTSWATAATNIQDAVSAAVVGDEILVTNGIYRTGVRTISGSKNRLAVTKAVTVRSANGPAVTSIAGYQVPGTTNGLEAVRCVYITNGAVLVGFTLTNGATQNLGSGGGVWCESGSAVISNCVLTGNSASQGGGAYRGTLQNCTLTGNRAADGGGVYYGTLTDCTLTGNMASGSGGGAHYATLSSCLMHSNSAHSAGAAYNCTLTRCLLTGNSGFYGGGTSGGDLSDCTVVANSAAYGGGSDSGVLTNCILLGNSAALYGGGAHLSILYNCIVASNSATGLAAPGASGGGANQSTLYNCTLIGNFASGPSGSGGGASSGTLNNCIVYYNTAATGANYTASTTLRYCCTTPMPALGADNIISEPQMASGSHLSATSPCIGRGSRTYATGVDVDGEPWANPPTIGCDEYWPGSVTGALTAAIVLSYTNVAVGFEVDFQALITGRASGSQWDFGDGTVVSNRPWISHAWAAPGEYVVELKVFNESYPEGIAAGVTVHVTEEVHYVSPDSASPVAPYISWATAATNIQAAVDAAMLPGSIVLVTNGVYRAGGRVIYGISNRLALLKPVTVQSVNGPEVTSIMGYQVPGITNGPAAVRCVYLTNAARLVGFTLSGGATLASGDSRTKQSGGGVWCESTSALISNCVLAGNSAVEFGGGAYYGTLKNCTLRKNSAFYGGGVYSATLKNCSLLGNFARTGGAASLGSLIDCTLRDNSAETAGGAFKAILYNCVLVGNSSGTVGGATSESMLNNCTLTGNSASNSGGGAYSSRLNNCIAYYNTAPSGANFYMVYQSTLKYCCTTPLPTGVGGNFTNLPVFVDTNAWRDLRLQANSPCINAGDNAFTNGATDLNGESRISGGTVDVGAYEFQEPTSKISYAWLQSFGLATDGSSDSLDSDADGLNNWQEWRCLTDPTDPASVLRMLSATNATLGIAATWSSVTNRTYTLELSTNLGGSPAFVQVRSNLAGLWGSTSYTDTNVLGPVPRFYRVSVEQ